MFLCPLPVSADKSTNLYSMCKESQKKLLNENITKNYKKSCGETKHKIDHEGKGIASKLVLDDRTEAYAEREAFITLKDRKDNFRSKPASRLINPAKTEIRIVSKQIVEKINKSVWEATHVLQWRNTQAVIDWYSDLKNKLNETFIKFEIVEFYPSISEELLERAINYAKSISAITEQQECIIWHSRKSLLFNEKSTWTKKDWTMFDVTMGSFDGAEICELVGLYTLNLLSSTFNK